MAFAVGPAAMSDDAGRRIMRVRARRSGREPARRIAIGDEQEGVGADAVRAAHHPHQEIEIPRGSGP